MLITSLSAASVLISLSCTPSKLDFGGGIEKTTYELHLRGENFGEGPQILAFEQFDGRENGKSFNQLEVGNLLKGIEYNEVNVFGSQGQAIIDENGLLHIMRIPLEAAFNKILVSYKVGIPPGNTSPAETGFQTWSESSVWKMAWLMNGEKGYNNDEYFDICSPTIVSGKVFLTGNSNRIITRGYPNSYSLGNIETIWSWDSYNHFTFGIGQSGGDNFESFFTFSNRSTGVKSVDVGEESAGLRGPEVSVDHITIPGWVRTNVEDNFQAVYDDIYIAAGENAFARIEITDTPEYESATTRYLLLPKNWSDNSIKAHVPKEVKNALRCYYVHRFDSNNMVYSYPQKLCFSV